MRGPLRAVLVSARDDGYTHFRLLGVPVNLAFFLLAVEDAGPEVATRRAGEALELIDATGKIPGVPLLTLTRGAERGC